MRYAPILGQFVRCGMTLWSEAPSKPADCARRGVEPSDAHLTECSVTFRFGAPYLLTLAEVDAWLLEALRHLPYEITPEYWLQWGGEWQGTPAAHWTDRWHLKEGSHAPPNGRD